MTGYADILRMCGAAVLAFICIRIPSVFEKGSMTPIVTAAVSVTLVLCAFQIAKPLFSFLDSVTAPYLPEPYGSLLGRALAFGITVQLTSDAVRDAGEGALADKLELVGRASLLTLGLPIYRELFSLARALIG